MPHRSAFRAAVVGTLVAPVVLGTLIAAAPVAAPSTPGDMRARIEREIARWKRLVELKNIERQ